MFFFCFVVAQIDTRVQGQETDQDLSEPSEGSFLDALINDDPGASPSADTAPTEPEPAAAPVAPLSHPSATGSSANGGTGGTSTGTTYRDYQTRSSSASYSSSPDDDIDEARVQETPDIPKFSHKAHIEDVGAECVQCHQTLFSELVRGYKVGPSMKEICSQCHNGTDAPAELLAGFSDEKEYIKPTMPLFSHTTHIQHTEKCNTCHKDIYKPLKKIRKVPPMKLCMGCHDNRTAEASCAVCHEHPDQLKPKSHNARWVYRNGHGNDARYNRKECFECHAERECNECHRGQSSFEVHRPGYRFSHGMDARTRTVNCAYCHDTENSCIKCHTRKR